MQLIRRYYNFLFSFFLVFPLLIFAAKTGFLGLVFSLGVIFLGGLFFRNSGISLFLPLFLIPATISFNHIFDVLTLKNVTVLFVIAFLCYVFNFAIVRGFPVRWAWFLVLYLWLFWFFWGDPKGVIHFVLVLGIFFVVAKMLFHSSLELFETPSLIARTIPLLGLLIFAEMMWVVGILPLGYLFAPVFLLLFVYLLLRISEYYIGKKSIRYIVYPTTFTFFTMVVILLIAMQKPF